MNDEIQKLEDKYIDLLLKRCINFDKSKILFINYNTINQDFIDKIVIKAKKMEIEEIYLDGDDSYERRDKLSHISIEDIETDPYFDKSIWNEYALKNASFLMLTTELPHFYDNIDSLKLAKANYINRKTRNIFREKELSYVIPWCIAALPNEIWASDLFPNDKDANFKLFNYICKMCMVDQDDPIKSWENYLIDVQKKVDYLNQLKIRKLHYKNGLGTDLTVEMPDDYSWCSASEHLKDNMLVNMPSYEIFASPNLNKTEGIVYSSKPLYYGGGIVDKFYIKFKNGKVSDFSAEKGYNILKSIIESDEYSSYLGEVALVDYDSLISNTKLVFKNTLFDENAACHLALGGGFKKCINNLADDSYDGLLKVGINPSKNHVDFMIGTSDLDIEAETNQGKKLLFKKGNFNIKDIK